MKFLLLVLSLSLTFLSAQVIEKYAKDAQTIIKQMQTDLKDYNQTLVATLDKNETKHSFSKRQKLIKELNNKSVELQKLTEKSILEDLQKSYHISIYSDFTCPKPYEDALCLDNALKASSTQASSDLLSNLHTHLKNHYALSDINISLQTQKTTVEKIAKSIEPQAFHLYVTYDMNATIHTDLISKIDKQTFILDENLTTKNYVPKTQPTLLQELVVSSFTYTKTLGNDPFPKPLAVTKDDPVATANETVQAKEGMGQTGSDKTVFSQGKSKDDKASISQLLLLKSQNRSLQQKIEDEKKISVNANLQLQEAKQALAQLENRLNSAKRSRGFYIDGTVNYSHMFDQGNNYVGPRARIGYTIGNHSFGVSYESISLLDNGLGIYDGFDLFGLDYTLRDGRLNANITLGAGRRQIDNRDNFFVEYEVPLFASMDLYLHFGEIGFYLDLGVGMQYIQTNHQQFVDSYYIAPLNYTINKDVVGARAFLRIGLQ